jgi:hypothetical protein
MPVVQWLIDRRASLDVKDRAGRTAVIHAILSRNVALVAFLVNLRTTLSITDKFWGWTPLHYAAYMNSHEMLEMLLSRRASPYMRSIEGWTPLRCAIENNAAICAGILTEFVFQEPAQVALPTGGAWATNVWVGCHRAAHVRWATDRGFRAVLGIYSPGHRDPKHLWLGSQDETDDVRTMAVDLEVDDTDPGTTSWERLLPALPRMLVFIESAVAAKRELLVHCEYGVSTSAAVVAFYMVIKRRMRLEPALAQLKSARREVSLSPSLYLGLMGIQEELDRRKLLRLDHRLRHSAVLSLGF